MGLAERLAHAISGILEAGVVTTEQKMSVGLVTVSTACTHSAISSASTSRYILQLVLAGLCGEAHRRKIHGILEHEAELRQRCYGSNVILFLV